MTSSTILTTLTKADTPKVVGLLRKVFRNPPSEAEWNWYAFGSPFGPSRIYAGQNASGELLGCFGFHPSILRIAGHLVSGSFGHHLAIAPEARGGGLFIRLSEFAFQEEQAAGIRFVYGPPNQNASRPHKILMAWRDFFSLEVLSKKPAAHTSHSCENLAAFGSAYEAMYEEWSHSLSFCTHKTAAWMNWRFLNRPVAPYTTLAYYNRGKMTGYVILKRWVEPNGYRKAHIMDLVALDLQGLAEVLSAADAFSADCDELNLWNSPDYPYRGSLVKHGFTAQPELRQTVIIKDLQDSVLTFPVGQSTFMYGDADGY